METITHWSTTAISNIQNLLCGILAASIFAALPVAAKPKHEYTQWEFVCSIRHVDCSNIPAPATVKIPLGPYTYGEFRPDWDPRYIFINMWLDDPTMVEVVEVHEMSHYLDYFIDRLPVDEFGNYSLPELCKSEETGFNVANIWVIYKGYDQELYARYDWIQSYPHCW